MYERESSDDTLSFCTNLEFRLNYRPTYLLGYTFYNTVQFNRNLSEIISWRKCLYSEITDILPQINSNNNGMAKNSQVLV